ncbi:MAG: hypothetical protein ACRDPC_24530, partial [Solirubrobacteraceae bacterium]
MLIALLVALFLAPAARAGTYEHRTVSPPGSPGFDGWTPAIWAPGGFVSTGGDGGGLWAGFFARSGFAPGELAEWAYAAPAGTTISAWAFSRRVAGIGPGDWNTLFQAVTDGRSRLVAFDVPSVNRAWGRVGVDGLGASRLVARLVCGGPGSCHRSAAGTTLHVRDIVVVLHDAHAPSVTGVGGDLATDAVLAGRPRLSFSASDRGAGVYRVLVEVDGRPYSSAVMSANGGRCRDLVPGGSFQSATRVPCPLSAGATAALDTTRLANGRHTIHVLVEDAAGNRTTVLGPTTKTIANRRARPRPPAAPPPATVSPPPATPPPPATAPPTSGVAVHAWLERRGRRATKLTARHGERVRLRGRITDADGRPLPGAAPELAERLVDGHGHPLRPRDLRRGAEERAGDADGLVGRANGLVGRRPRGSWTAVTGVRSRPDGRFTAFTRIGPSRRLRLTAPGGARSPVLTLRVRAPLSVRVVRRGRA